ncbi:hypothetical protein LRP52_44545 [Photobacterium sp. ZSDE20]|uniref:Uncharacterized protein n=1 Tax=Photobacterium pectinilyticum TaxID=2906793 RepID=A0ABT1N8P5_9GAMM|nr:hypothetical protein [Photobacterium sp. ZSDE20]MCQ1061108.1 hypothetical protein [Photobacterium sp. ZSDE20]MDD1829240.1 hypothetical protein [Photobacterium sp. ZSDE20]
MAKSWLALLVSTVLLTGCGGSGSGEDGKTGDDGDGGGSTAPKITGLSKMSINGVTFTTVIQPDGRFVGSGSGSRVAEGKIWHQGGELHGWGKLYGDSGDRELVEHVTGLKGDLGPDNTFVIENDSGDSMMLRTHIPSVRPEYLGQVKPIFDYLTEKGYGGQIINYYPQVNFYPDLTIKASDTQGHFHFYQCRDGGDGKFEPLLSDDQDWINGSFSLVDCFNAERNGVYLVGSFAQKDSGAYGDRTFFYHQIIHEAGTFSKHDWDAYHDLDFY